MPASVGLQRGGRACTRYVKVSGSFTHKGATGKLNRFTFTGRLSGRKLGAGRYRLNARPADAAGNRGTTKRAPFRIRGYRAHGAPRPATRRAVRARLNRPAAA